MRFGVLSFGLELEYDDFMQNYLICSINEFPQQLIKFSSFVVCAYILHHITSAPHTPNSFRTIIITSLKSKSSRRCIVHVNLMRTWAWNKLNGHNLCATTFSPISHSSDTNQTINIDNEANRTKSFTKLGSRIRVQFNTWRHKYRATSVSWICSRN